MKKNNYQGLVLRHFIAHTAPNDLDEKGFLEAELPVLLKTALEEDMNL
jgi:aspartyl-tRNA synthetase